MRQAADILSSAPAMQIRYLEAMQAMAKSANSKVIFLPAANQTMLEEFSIPGGQERWVCFSATLSDETLPQTPPTIANAIQWKFDGVSVEKQQ